MANYRVVLEIEVEETSPLAAAQTVQLWLQEKYKNSNWQYYVQKDSRKDDEVFSVDLDEEDEDAVLECDNYIPLIK